MYRTDDHRAPSPAHADYLRKGYFPELDGLRALCVLLVVSVHMYDGLTWLWEALAGARGVTVFFVLSGYLITTLALREEARRGRVCLSAFFVRRGCRIFPLYYLTLSAYCVLIFALGFAPQLRPNLLLALPYYLLYLQEVAFYRWVILGQQDVPFFQSWSLGIEEKFYLAWPLLAFWLGRGAPARRRAWAVGLTCLLAAAPQLLTLAGPERERPARCVASYFSILAGCAVALLLHERR